MATEDLDDAIAAAEADLADLVERRSAIAERLAALRQERGGERRQLAGGLVS